MLPQLSGRQLGHSFLRALDTGGIVREGKEESDPLDPTLRALDRALDNRIDETASESHDACDHLTALVLTGRRGLAYKRELEINICAERQ